MATASAEKINVALVSNDTSIEIKFDYSGLIFTNQNTGQNEHWSQGGKARYSFELGKLFFIRDDQAWIADNSSINKTVFKDIHDKLLLVADNAAKALELPRKTLIEMHDKAYLKALSIAVRVTLTF